MLSRRRLVISGGAAALAGPALGQAAGPAPYAGPQVAAPAAPLGPPYEAAASIEAFDPSLAELIDPSTPVEKILDGFVWAEGPVWVGGPDGYLLCSDTRANRIVKWSPPGRGKTAGETWKAPAGYEGPNNQGWAPNLAEPGTNGLILARGGLVAADHGNRALAFFDLKTRAKTPIVGRFEGRRFNNSPNDLVLHPNGSIFFTDPPYGLLGAFGSPDRELDYTGLFRLDPDDRVTLIDRTLRPNGVGLSPDGSRLYVTDSSGWVVFDLDARGDAADRRLFVARAAAEAGGDSLKIDDRGNMWTSTGNSLSIFDPQGRRLGVIRTDQRISNCEFGADGHVYICSNTRLLRAEVKVGKIARGVG